MAADNGLALQFCNSFSVSDLQRRPTAVTAIPERNLLVVGSPGHLATYDAVNSVRHAQFVIPKNHTPRLLHVLPSKADVVIVCLEWTVYVQPLRPSKSAMVMDLSGVKKKPLTDPLLTSMLGSSSSGRLPVLFVASALKDSIRSAYLLPVTGEKGKVTKELQPGFKLPLDKGKGIVALASHPFAPVLTVLTVNGELQLYQHTQGSPTLTPIVQYTMLLEESKTASPLVAGAHVSEVACPRVPNTAMIFIFLPRLSLFYIMTHSVGATPVPFMRIPWMGCNQVLSVEVSPALNTLIAVAGNTADGKFRMRAWTILGDEGCSLEGLRLQPRNCSQNIDQLEASTDAGVVSKTPDWAKLWSGNAPMPAASTQGSLLDLTTVVYPDKPSTAAAVVPQRAFVMAASNLLMVRYMQRNNQGGNINFCPVAAFRFVDMDHPTQHHPAALAGAIHTSPIEWQVQEIDGEPVLTLPHAVPFLNERAACIFAPAVQDSRLVEMLPPKDGTGRWLKPDHMVYSRVRHVAFVFCALVQDTSQRTFTHVDFAAQPTEEQTRTKLFFQGNMGTFLGPTDSAFLVLESRKIGADNFAVYTTSPELTEESLLGYTYVALDTGDCAATVWAGPPACQMLKEAEYDPIDGSLIEEELVLGLGLALVGTAQGSLLLVLVPDVSEGDPEGDLLSCHVQCEMQLLESERIAQVAWNTMVHRTQVGYASHCLGAILTSQRIVITNGALSMLQSVAVAEPAAAVPHIITSLLWVGPALLMSHASGRVEHVMLNGKRSHVCSLARVGSYVLAGATADSLILLHSRGPAWMITTRKVLVGSLIMQAWLCMLSEGHAYGTWPNVRRELQLLVKYFNVQPASDVALAEALLEAGCGDMLRRCTQFVTSAGVSTIAHAAASNDWQYATDQVIKEYETSAYSPCAPPETSQLRQALITISLGAMSQGKWHCAERCLAASGETLLLMLLHALQHNRAALQQALKSQGDTSPMSTLAMLLLAADARIGLRQPLQKDWHMSRPVQDTDASTWDFSEALIPQLKAQADRSVRNDVYVEPGEEGPIPPLHEGGLASHLGLTHAEIILNATIVPSLAPTTALSRPLTDAPDSTSDEPKKPMTAEEIEAARVRDEFLEQFEGDSMFMDSAELAQRNAGDEDSGLISVNNDDEDDEGEVGDLHARNMKRAMRRQKQKATEAGIEELAAAEVAAEAKKAQALGPEGSVPMGMARKMALEAAGKPLPQEKDVWDELGLMRPEQSLEGAAGAEEAQEEQDDDPFAAFGDMALPEPTPAEAAPEDMMPGDNMPAVDGAAQNGHDGGMQLDGAARGRHTFQSGGAGADQGHVADPAGGVMAAPEAAARAPDTSSPQAQALLDVNAGQTPGFLMGVHFMFAAQWNQALQSFAQAYASCGGLERVQVGQYIAAVGILQGYSMVGDDEACRLSRYAAAMPLLLTDHASFLVHDTVSRNMRAGNSTWAVRRLEEFIAVCQAKGQQSVAQGVAGMLQQARAMGAGNRTVATDENTNAFVERINAAQGGEQIYGLCTSLRSGMM